MPGPAFRSFLPVALLASGVGVAGCGEDGSDTTGVEPTAEVVVLDGDGQTGVSRQLLQREIRVQLLNRRGLPVAFGELTATAEPDGAAVWPGSLRTDGNGEVTFRWRLGEGEGTHRLTVASDAPDARGIVNATALPFPELDAVRVPGAPADSPLGAVVDGRTAAGPADDYRFVGAGSVLGIGDWRAPTGTPEAEAAEVLVFRPGAGMLHVPEAAFTAGPDTFDLVDDGPVRMDLTVWLAAGSRAPVEQALELADAIFGREGLGVLVGDVEWVEEVEVPASVSDFSCADRAALEGSAGRREGRINVYVVERVDGSAGRGQACEIGGSFVALGGEAGVTLLAHELGHNLSLLHVDRLDDFDVTNVMHSASDSRAGLTEGQIVRARLNRGSAVNATFGHHPSEALRICFNAADDRCPPLELRLWPDGSFGPFPVGRSADRTPEPTCTLDPEPFR